MIGAELERIYRLKRAENPYMGALHTARLARWLLEEPALEGLNDSLPCTLELESEELELELEEEGAGFHLRIRADYDYDSSPTEWLGTFTTEPTDVRNPRGWYLDTWTDWQGKERAEIKRDSSYYPYVDLADGFRYSDHYEWARSAGMARSVADDYARARVAEDVERLEGTDYCAAYVVVTASREGVELGSASLGGFELAVTDRFAYDMNTRWLAETALELAREAILEARAALARLVGTTT